MPRKSKAELSVAPVIKIVPRPPAPAELTDEQAEVWDVMITSVSGEWFPKETHPLLVQFCRHVVAARRISQIVEKEDGFDVDQFDRLLKMQERESRLISSLATRMRITQQTTYDKSKKRKPDGPRPWDISTR